MTPQDPLQALHPLREPPPVGWWPPAPGWWFIAILFATLLLLLAAWVWRRYRRNRYRRQATAELLALQTRSLSGSERVQQINAILKRSALMAYTETRVAPLGGSDWIKFLETTLPHKRRAFSGIDSSILYTQDPSPDMTNAFAEAALTWVRCHQREVANA
ncbi:MAG: DUF4381 domain-containing protein [Chromatocurvus sp.]